MEPSAIRDQPFVSHRRGILTALRRRPRITRPKTVTPSGLYRSCGPWPICTELRERLSKMYDPLQSGYRKRRSGRNCGMRRHLITGVALGLVAAGCLGGLARTTAAQEQKPRAVLPIFEADSHFPTMPDHMLLGGVGGATADSHGNV